MWESCYVKRISARLKAQGKRTNQKIKTVLQMMQFTECLLCSSYYFKTFASTNSWNSDVATLRWVLLSTPLCR